ncbi:hypothetical protein G5714_002623 [Onychostoma macrolepis]|uniref:Uncharacterized protein n=1 Tax=Onychostoma macrolepis TaxID=369639 RepID=A0A7J6D8A3_9TELE|nr:hypothetical protein G5714_002623 [Onychostoma macrolepis]
MPKVPLASPEGDGSQQEGIHTLSQERNVSALEEAFKSNVRDFYTRDDVSRVTTRKTQTITQAKVRMQKRFLVDTLKNLHKKYLAENPRKSVSYSLFCRLRPFWVVHPTLSDRETCLCKMHENLDFVAQKLFSMKLLNAPEPETLMAEICCDQTNKECMYNDCGNCKEKEFTLLREYEGSTQGPPAIWEHLSPILSYVKNVFPAVTVVHFLSDGPCTQYRQKGTF